MRLLIVADEPRARDQLVALCQANRSLEVVGQVRSRIATLETIEEHAPELLVLDIGVHDAKAFDVLRSLNGTPQLPIIVVGERFEHALAAFDHDAVDYLNKPFDGTRFEAAIDRAKRRAADHANVARPLPDPELVAIERRSSLLALQKANRIVFIEVGTIDFIESNGNYVIFHVGDQQYLSRDTVKHLSGTLASYGFMRIERSLLLNLHRVAYVERQVFGEFAFVLANGRRLISGRTYRRAIRMTMRRRPILGAAVSP